MNDNLLDAVMRDDDTDRLIYPTIQIFEAWVKVQPTGLSIGAATDALKTIYGALRDISTPAVAEPKAPVKEPPTAKQIRDSITDDYLISFEDGKPYKMLKRHIGKLGLSPAQYRAKWGLAKDYPMTAPGYSARRSALAKEHGLGTK